MALKPIQGKPTLDFPLSFNLKVIMNNNSDLSVLQTQISSHLNSSGVKHSEWKHTLSKKGSYVSFSVQVVLQSLDIMETMYAGFKSMKDVKMVI